MSERSDTTEESSLPAASLSNFLAASRLNTFPDSEPQITVVVPTRNEAHNIAPLLERLSKATQDIRVEILFVDDSNDDTSRVVSDLADQLPLEIRLLARPPSARNGLSGAVVDGLREARGKWVCVMDADLQHPPETIPLMWEQAQRTGADMVVGSRRGDVVGPIGLTRMRSLTSKVLTILARMLFPRTLKNVSDPLTGLFMVCRQAVDVNELRPDGFKILLEILVRCPALHVSEIQFDFAQRHEGESKADVREGVRFFRHLVRLRVTVNPHLMRFLVVISVGVAANSLLLWIAVDGLEIQPLLASILAVELFFLWVQIGFHYWVFRDRAALPEPGEEQETLRRGFLSSFIVSQLFLILVYLPILFLLSSIGSIHYLLTNFCALLLVGLFRYGLSEQWIWTKGGMIWQHQTYFYNIHNLLKVESQVPLAELQYFEKSPTDSDIDIQIRLDRQGTPSRLPGGISYDEQLGRFGFGLTVLPEDFTQVIVSPLLERSPSFLFTNIVEPILRWRFVRKEYALVKAAAITRGDSAILIQGEDEMGNAVSALCQKTGYAFMADDLIIMGKNGRLYGYPKPVTVQQNMVLDSALSPSSFVRLWSERVTLAVRRALYTQFTRRIGLWLSARELPAATMNTYLQWLVPQPKQMLGNVIKGINYADSAQLLRVIAVQEERDFDAASDQVAILVDRLQQGEEANTFQPHPLLAQRLRKWQGEDLLVKERKIIEDALEKAAQQWIVAGQDEWWRDLAAEISSNIPKVTNLSTPFEE